MDSGFPIKPCVVPPSEPAVQPDSAEAAARPAAGVPPILRHFTYDRLPRELQVVSEPFHHLAHHLVDALPASPELSAGLRKLLEAKDCAVRAALPPEV